MQTPAMPLRVAARGRGHHTRAVETSLTVAAVQVESRNGEPAENLQRAAKHVADAAARGARLILCPEFLATGYVFDDCIWDAGESAGGRTERWLALNAERHCAFLGASFLEADGDDFYNTFSLFGPDGKLRGRVRKGSLPFFEGRYFKPCAGSKIIRTELGVLGVGICNDTQTAGFLREVCSARPDLILMPHSAPTPTLPGPIRKLFVSQLSETAGRYAHALGVPVVMANKVASTDGSTPVPPLPRVRVRWRFVGHSCIYDADGTRLQQLRGVEGALVARVHLDPRRKQALRAPTRGYWSFGPKLGAGVIGGMLLGFELLGKRAYTRSALRRKQARAHAPPPAKAPEWER